jgi:hypothetical protein
MLYDMASSEIIWPTVIRSWVRHCAYIRVRTLHGHSMQTNHNYRSTSTARFILLRWFIRMCKYILHCFARRYWTLLSSRVMNYLNGYRIFYQLYKWTINACFNGRIAHMFGIIGGKGLRKNNVMVPQKRYSKTLGTCTH